MREELEFRDNSFSKKLYCAGLPIFPRNFTRDSIISALLADDIEMLKNQLEFNIIHQGNTINALTGEEVGKIFHEFPGFEIDKGSGKFTTYNGCDTTALFLIGVSYYVEQTKDFDFLQTHKESIKKAIEYIVTHLNSRNEFVEDPKFSNSSSYALKVTYWKDSVLLNRENGEPHYPIVYTLVHILNMVAIKNISKLLEDFHLQEIYCKMKSALEHLYDFENECFYIAKDASGVIRGVTTDSLHALMYLEEDDIIPQMLEGIVKSSQNLETNIGYRTMSEDLAQKMEDSYHAKTVWPFEQAVIHKGASKFNLQRVCEISSKIMMKIKKEDYEIYTILDNSHFEAGGCHTQLWTIAAKKYFKNIE
ncbi:MAG: hypothetical protein LAT82_04035 [Nanoarchaeota archaeon]|nr:hypothetical protein [Nanoarchaeota archaeon]